MKEVWYLENINLFKILCPHKYPKYKDKHGFDKYGKEDYIYFKEDAANKVYLIDKGKVKLGYYTEEGEEVIKSILSKGEVFGEKAALGGDKRSEFAQSLDSSTTICPIPVNTLQEVIRDNAKFSISFYKFINFRIRKLERRLEILLFKDSKTRLQEFIFELSDDYGYCCDETGDTVINHPYTQKDISSLIGTSRPTLNILLNDLKENGTISFQQKNIRILKKN
jgi:CRP-like cAMP-binding protein